MQDQVFRPEAEESFGQGMDTVLGAQTALHSTNSQAAAITFLLEQEGDVVEPFLIEQEIDGHESLFAVDVVEVQPPREMAEGTVFFPEWQTSVVIDGLKTVAREVLAAEVEMRTNEPGSFW